MLAKPPLGAPPTATKTPEPDDDEELSEVLEELSEVLVELSEVSSEESSEDEVVLSVLAVLLSSDFAHEETITAMLTIRTNQEVRLFILSFKENDQEDVYKTVSSSDCPIKQKNEQKLNTNLLYSFYNNMKLHLKLNP